MAHPNLAMAASATADETTAAVGHAQQRREGDDSREGDSSRDGRLGRAACLPTLHNCGQHYIWPRLGCGLHYMWPTVTVVGCCGQQWHCLRLQHVSWRFVLIPVIHFRLMIIFVYRGWQSASMSPFYGYLLIKPVKIYPSRPSPIATVG